MGRKTYIAMGAVILAAMAAVTVAVRRREQPPAAASELVVQEKAGKPGRYETSFQTMGTDCRLEVAAGDAAGARRMFEAALPQLRTVERLMSSYQPDSEVSRLNRSDPGQRVELSDHTLAVMRTAGEASRLTGGAFDVTYAPLRTLWRRAQQADQTPGQDAIEQALAAVGHAKLVLEDDRARFAAEGMTVDLGGIAKGYAIDLATEALQAAGARAGIVDIGGDLRLFGLPEGGGRWRVLVARPPDIHETIVLRVPPSAVTTSGDYARHFSVEGRQFSHIIDPRTGWPVTDVPSATVVAPDATMADALATALSVLGAAEGVPLIDSLPDVECMIMERQPDGTVRKVMSKGFSELVED